MPPRICRSFLFVRNTSCALSYNAVLSFFSRVVISLCTVDLEMPNCSAACRTVAPFSIRYLASWIVRSSGKPFTVVPPALLTLLLLSIYASIGGIRTRFLSLFVTQNAIMNTYSLLYAKNALLSLEQRINPFGMILHQTVQPRAHLTRTDTVFQDLYRAVKQVTRHDLRQ